MPNRKIIGAAAMTAALATGGVVGAALGSPGASGAQDAPTTAPTTAPAHPGDNRPNGWDHGPRDHWGHHGGLDLSAAAEALGLTPDALRTRLADGDTLAQVAAAQGIDRKVLIDALVAAASARLDEARTALPERMADLVDRTVPARGPVGFGGPGRPGGLGGPGLSLDAAADAVGLTVDELRTRLSDGTTIAEVAEAEGVDLQEVIDALVAKATERITAALAEGKLTEAQADQWLGGLEARIGERLTSPARGRGPGNGRAPGRWGPGGHGPDGEDPAPPPADDPTSSDGD